MPITNAFLVTSIAGKQQATFAKSFCIVNTAFFALWAVLLALLPPNIDGGGPADPFYYFREIACASPWIMGFVLQILGTAVVSQEQKLDFIDLVRLSPQSAHDIERTIEQLENAPTSLQAGKFATCCLLQMAKDKSYRVDQLDSVQKFVDELIRQKRFDSANKISTRYLELITSESANHKTA